MNLRHLRIALVSLASIGALAGSSLPAVAVVPIPAAPIFTLAALESGSVVDSRVGSATDAAKSAERDLTVVESSSGQLAVANLSLLRLDAPAMWAAGHDFVDLSWADVGAARYVVTRGGQVIADTTGTSWRDLGVASGEDLDYVVSPIPGDVESDSEELPIWGLRVLVPSSTGELTLKGLAAERDAAAQAISYSNSAVQFMTFIPQAYVDAPPAGCVYTGSSYKYGGDNRSWAPSSSKYRTRMQANVTWATGGTVTTSVATGITRVYSKSTGALVASRQASTNNLVVKRLGGSSSSVDLRFTFTANDPFCTAIASVQGAFTMTITRSGNWSIISGSHRQMPNFQVYVHNGSNWTAAYLRSYASLACLVAVACPYASMSGYVGSY